MNSGFIVRNSDVGGDWNMTFICPATVRNVITPIDELIFFRRVETTNQICLGWKNIQCKVVFGILPFAGFHVFLVEVQTPQLTLFVMPV